MNIRNRPPLSDTVTRMTYHQLLLLWCGLVVAFAAIYTALSYISVRHGLSHLEGRTIDARFFNSLYFSIITATSVGYGDLLPLGISKIFAAIESMMAVVVMAVLVTKLVSHRQEIALREVHKLSFEDIFHNTRDELHTARRDFDRFMEKIENKLEISDEDWMNVIVGYRQCNTVMQEIPDFYDGVNHLYTIDAQREELLQESVHRTLHRINQLLDVMSKHGIDWISHEQSISELRELVETTRKAANVWRKKSPYQKEEAFERILHLNESVHARLAQALPIKIEADESI